MPAAPATNHAPKRCSRSARPPFSEPHHGVGPHPSIPGFQKCPVAPIPPWPVCRTSHPKTERQPIDPSPTARHPAQHRPPNISADTPAIGVLDQDIQPTILINTPRNHRLRNIFLCHVADHVGRRTTRVVYPLSVTLGRVLDDVNDQNTGTIVCQASRRSAADPQCASSNNSPPVRQVVCDVTLALQFPRS